MPTANFVFGPCEEGASLGRSAVELLVEVG